MVSSQTNADNSNMQIVVAEDWGILPCMQLIPCSFAESHHELAIQTWRFGSPAQETGATQVPPLAKHAY